MNQYLTIILSVLAVIFIFSNQLRVGPVKGQKFNLQIVMFILGLYKFISYLDTNTLTVISWITIAVSMTILSIGMSGIIAYTVKLWNDNGIIYRQGTWVTIVLWVVSIALYLVLDQIGHVGLSTSFLYSTITLTVQKLIERKRADHIINKRH